MIQVSKKKWDSIHKDYKSQWTEQSLNWQPKLPKNYIGRRSVMSGCISDKIGALLTEGVHFEIVEDDQ